ncbi:ethylene-responsive kinase Le-CTR1 [Medicago truncatula]|uniref:Ethylene-responsive kinase Le-CTR1 n=1 Tax=Medicago truncatula TaxID=3880 RepID=G7LHA7_MEDTR|nr:ethylene-responsive kinase Le-CTR1 [Medicago truncatula]
MILMKNFNAIAYDKKVMDGVYDIYGIDSSLIEHGKMPLLVDLKTVPTSQNFDYEIILMNCVVDVELEEKTFAFFEQRSVSELGLFFDVELSQLETVFFQKLADVVSRMGRPVSNAAKIMKKWAMRSHKLRDSFRAFVLLAVLLDFCVTEPYFLCLILADRINIRCMLVKGSYYAGTDDGALNLINEYIIDMMGARGALIHAELPSSQIQNYALGFQRL